MTLDVYADLFDDDLDSVADALDRSAREATSPEVRPRSRTRGHNVATPTATTLFD